MTVSKLFEPLPVRLQEFKKTAKKQYATVISLVQSFCLAYPSIRFILSNISKGNRSIAVQSSGSGHVESVFKSIFGPTSLSNMIEFDESKSVQDLDGDCQISFRGLISKPKPLCGRGDTDRQFLFLNGRGIDIPKISKTINQVYSEYNPSQYPVLVVFFKLPSEIYDRNVTPDKKTLILQNEDEILNVIRQAFIAIFEPYRGEFQLSNKIPAAKFPIQTTTTVKSSFKNIMDDTMDSIDEIPRPFRPSMCQNSTHVIDCTIEEISKMPVVDSGDKKTITFEQENLVTPLFIQKSDFPSMKLIGQFNLGFILVSFHDHILIVDQHASDEKCLYEKFRDETKIMIQPLIRYFLTIDSSPKRLFLSPQQDYAVMKYQNDLKDRGFDLTRKNNEWYLAGVPHIKNLVFDKSDFEETLSMMMENNNGSYICKRMNGVFASKACRSAVMIGDSLQKSKMIEIMENMAKLEQPWNCPHGRPTMRLLSKILSSN